MAWITFGAAPPGTGRHPPARRRALSTCATSVCTCHTGNLADAGSPGVRPRSALRADV